MLSDKTHPRAAERTPRGQRKHCAVFVANRGYALKNSRASLISYLQSAGWTTVIATADDADSQSLAGQGAMLEPVVFDRGGIAPAADIQCWRRLAAIYRRWQPKLIQHYNAKPLIFGSLAARRVLHADVRVVNTITGLGHAFNSSKVLAEIAGIGYRLAASTAACTVFQNRDDQALFLRRGWASEAKSTVVTGSGVDTQKFTLQDRGGREGSALTVIMLGRLLRQKGIEDFSDIARRVRQSRPNVRFLLAGESEPDHPDAVPMELIEGNEAISYLGRLQDILPLLVEADLLLFTSHREGVPRVVLEAASTGLPTVGFDVPGVRETVRDGETGYLVPRNDLSAMTMRVTELLDDAGLRKTMGQAARQLMERQFDTRIIDAHYLQLYRDLGLEIE